MADHNILGEDRIQDYIDDRLGERDRASVAAYLLANPEIGAEVEKLRRQNEALKAVGQEILDEPVPDRLRAALRRPEAGASHAPSQSGVTIVQPPARRTFLEAAAALLLFVAGGAVGWILHGELRPSPSEDDLLTSQIVYAYDFYDRERDYPIDFAVDRGQDLDGWISRSFERSVPAPDLAKFNFVYTGGRLVPTARTPIAHLQFENDQQQRLGLFFWRRSAEALPRGLTDNPRRALKIWVEGDLNLAVVGDRDNPDFDLIANDISVFYRGVLSTP